MRPMEDMLAQFRAWLEESKNKLASFTPAPPLSDQKEREEVLKQAQVSSRNVINRGGGRGGGVCK